MELAVPIKTVFRSWQRKGDDVFFKDIPLFSGLSVADHGLLLQAAVRRTYPRHTLLLQAGNPGERFYLLRKGRAKVFLGNDAGREVILAILSPGDFIGDMALLDNEPCSASVMTLEESEFVSIGKSEFQKVLASSPEMTINLLTAVARRLREANQQIELLALNDVRARVERLLRGLAELENGALVIPARLTHKDIAAMAGATREVVTRALHSLEEDGVVRVEGRRIMLMTTT